MVTNPKADLESVTASIVAALPKLDLFEQRLSLELYRSLAAGRPVHPSLLAERLGDSVGTVSHLLETWPVLFDSQERVVGYCGLSIATFYKSPHRLLVDGRMLSAWSAWDTLFLPQLLGKKTAVQSTGPTPGASVSLLVLPDKIGHVEPVDAQMSFLLPDAEAIQKNIVGTFCQFVRFFPTRRAGEIWVAQHPGIFLLSIDEAYEVGKNRAQYGAALR